MANEQSDESNLLLLSGMYSRIARQLGVHPSYVSRVARGERRSERVSRAIAAELGQLRGSSAAQDDPAAKESRHSAIADIRTRLSLLLRNDPRLRKMNAVIIDGAGERTTRRAAQPKRVTPASLSARLASNSRLLAISVNAFEKLSKKLDRIPHVLSVLDRDGIVLYSTGTTGMARREHRLPGADWSKDIRGLSSAARALAAGVPVAVVGAFDLAGTEEPSIRLACPVRLSDKSIVGALNLTMEVIRAKPDHMLDLCSLARRVCKFIENGPLGTSRKRGAKSRVQPFAEAAQHVASVLSLPELDPATRVGLSALLGNLENAGRETMLNAGRIKPRRQGSRVKAHGAS
jgi:DNA-binding transcriptional regulator YdaS (Cro superfamily)